MQRDPTIRMLCRKTGLALQPNDECIAQLFVAPWRTTDGATSFAQLVVGYERNLVIFNLQEDLVRRPSLNSTNPVPVQNQIEMIIGYGTERGFRRARLNRNGGVALVSNGQPASTDPHGLRSQGVPLRVESVYARIRALGLRAGGRPTTANFALIHVPANEA